MSREIARDMLSAELHLFRLEVDAQMLEESIFEVDLNHFVLEHACTLEKAPLRDRSNLLRHDDAAVACPEEVRCQNLEGVDAPPLAFSLRHRYHRDDVEVLVEAVVGYHQCGSMLTALLATYGGVQVDPIDLPAPNGPDMRHSPQSPDSRPSGAATSNASPVLRMSSMKAGSCAASS